MNYDEIDDRAELVTLAEPWNRIANRDYILLGYHPTDAQVERAEAERAKINARCAELNADEPVRIEGEGHIVMPRMFAVGG